MSVKQRIEALEEQVFSQDICPTCGGLHTRHWAEAMRAAIDHVAVCACNECCDWFAELQAQAIADSIPTSHR